MAKPTDAPMAKPTAAPTAKPTAAPTAKPTAAPMAEPTASQNEANTYADVRRTIPAREEGITFDHNHSKSGSQSGRIPLWWVFIISWSKIFVGWILALDAVVLRLIYYISCLSHH